MPKEITRRVRLDLSTRAELAIYEAIQTVEEMEANVNLTKAQILLSEAKDLVSDYVDSEIKNLN